MDGDAEDLIPLYWLRRSDLHRRSSGYEPDELLLLHRAINLLSLTTLARMSSSIVTKIDWSETINQSGTINQSRVSRSNFGAGSKNRTRDLMITNQLLYLLSYASETDVG